MSIISPSKQERIERHLMRQRGAGTRTISGTFGFAFGSSAPTSNEATPTSFEPAAKRRKTLLANGIGVTDECVGPARQTGKADGIGYVKGAKSRKRWAPELDVESIARSHPEAEDDSFIRMAKAGLKKQSKREESKQAVGADPVQPAKRGRPIRNAATKAAIKVADDLEEERRTVDKKRQLDQSDVNVAKSNRRKQKQGGPIEVIHLPSRTTHASNANVSSRDKDVGAKSSVREAIEETVPLECRPARGIYDHEEELEPATKVRTSRKHKQREEVAELSTEVDPKETGDTKGTKAIDKHADITRASETMIRRQAPNQRKKASGKPVSAQETNTKGAQQSLREPLKESDANVTLRHTSPEKPVDKKKRAHSFERKIEDTTAPVKCVEQEKLRPTKRRKVQVRQDDEVLEITNKDTAGRNGSVNTTSKRDVKSTVQGDNQIGITASTTSRGTGGTSSKRKKQQEHPKTAQEIPAQDEEDIDWLFQSLPTKQQPPMPRKQQVPSRKGPRTPKKLVDIDLDDLLSNIALFATAENQTNGINGPTVQAEATKTASGVHSRRKR